VDTETLIPGGLAREEYERVRRELTGYCYRMLGSLPDAEDAVQETMIRAWRGAASFEGRSAVRTWLHRIATNVCLDLLKERGRRALPMDLGPALRVRDADKAGGPTPEHEWILPAPDARILADTADPAQRAIDRESVRLAFIVALQRLPPRQRAVLILREVLAFSAAETAELLETTVASVNSALQRARATVPSPRKAPQDTNNDTDTDTEKVEELDQLLLDEYIEAFENYDMPRLTALLRADVVQSMPPFPLWIQGVDEVLAWLHGPGAECRGSKLIPLRANGGPACIQYRADGRGGHKPWSLVVMETESGKISALHAFVIPEYFATYGFSEAPDR
jgi:RNA polymerase sigma-70 factor (ECF subfamily)